MLRVNAVGCTLKGVEGGVYAIRLEGRFTSLTYNGPATTHDGEPAGGEWAATLTGPLAVAVLNWTEDRGDEVLLPVLREYVTERWSARYDLSLIAAVPHGDDTVQIYFVVS